MQPRYCAETVNYWDQTVADPASFAGVWPIDDGAEKILMITDWT